MTDYLKNSLLTSATDSCNSLEGIEGYADQEKALVQQQNRWFRFYAASTATPDGESIIAPANITPPAPGRWIREGFPGPVGPRPDKPVSLSSCNASAASLCTRTQGVVTPDTVATFTLELASVFAALQVPATGNVMVAARVQLVGVLFLNGNTPTPITQLYPIMIQVTNGVIAQVFWNATFETPTIPPGFTGVPGDASSSFALITSIADNGTEIDIVWTAGTGIFYDQSIPAVELCVAAVSGDASE